ncbi:2338_t:CDS:2 [Funneliformis caledonium]|uniref:2338_t:CDS:1 n=1 Tax=Funneliformis caledonium TaxID=1117310 RepID=A0A9N8Z465_9GLOM|nr:2338_t:CDS:2 [Funneliformis caledonium]
MNNQFILSFDELNNKLKFLLEGIKRLKHQHENLREENRETLFINLEKQLKESKRLNQQHKENNRETTCINSELKVKLQERDEQLEKLKRQVLNLEKQKLEKSRRLKQQHKNFQEENQETSQIEMSPQNLEKTVVNENDNEIKENNMHLISEIFRRKDSNKLANNIKHSWGYKDKGCIRILVGLDFVLQYDDKYNNVISWGFPALVKRSYRRKLKNKFKPKLPIGYIKAIMDYLREIGKETIEMRYPGIHFLTNVLLVLTYPEEYSDNTKEIMRESKAAAIYCIFKEHNLKKLGTTFMIIDCDETVNLTICKLMNGKQVDVVSKKSYKDESTFIDAEFVKYLRKKLGDRPVNLLRYEQMQYLIQKFSRQCKLHFTGLAKDFTYELDIDKTIPIVKRYISGDKRVYLKEIEWIIKFDINELRSIFDPFIENIIQLIHRELDGYREKCLALFLIGSFCESKYLQNRIKNNFQHRIYISVPTHPMDTITQGAVKYGLDNW